MLLDQGVLRNVRIARQGADPKTLSPWQFFHLRQRQPVDVDQLRRRFDAHFHQVDQVRSAAEKFCVRFRGERADCVRGLDRARIEKRVHVVFAADLLCASLIAATMFG